jgi:hypothetical protein
MSTHKAERYPTRYAGKNGVSQRDLEVIERTAARVTKLISRLWDAAREDDILVCQALARELEIEAGMFSMDAYLGRVLDALTEGGVEASKKRWKEWTAALDKQSKPKRAQKQKGNRGGSHA